MKTLYCFNRGTGLAGWSHCLVLVAFAAALSAGSSLPGQQPDRGNPVRSSEFENCKANLNRIFDAMQAYRKVYHIWPARLSDLHPDYISDLNRFLCPEYLRYGARGTNGRGVRTGVFEDPVPTDYSYEFSTKAYPLWAGITSTEREYKLRQMNVIGSNVPIVRCMGLHGPNPNLFLSVGGSIFEQSGRDWESLFTNDQLPIEQLLPPALFLDLAPVPGRFTNNIIPRPPATDLNLIDLSRHYTSDLRTPWLWRNQAIDLSDIPLGSIQLDGIPVRLDVRGVIQLTSTNMKSPFPRRSGEIAVDRKGHALHFLQGAVQGEPYVFGKKRSPDAPGTEIGRYAVRYVDGQTLQIPIRYGRDVLVWDDVGDDPTAHEAKVAWQGTNKTVRIRLYHQRWQNPRPETEISSLDFISNMGRAAPFLIAVTLEP